MSNHLPLFREALAHHSAGRLTQAGALYAQVLKIQPTHHQSLHLLGVIAAQQHDYERAFALIGRAIAIHPTNAEYHFNLALALRSARRLDEAIDAGRRAIELRPDYFEAHHGLGVAALEADRLDDAIFACKQALALRPSSLPALLTLGAALRRRGRFDEAVDIFRAALALDHRSASIHNHLGAALTEQSRQPDASHHRQRADEAITCFQTAARLKPDFVDAHMNLGIALMQADRNAEALSAFDHVVRLRPDHADAHLNRGVLLKADGRFDEAVEACLATIALRPDCIDARNNLGLTLVKQRKIEQALEAYRAALAIKPDAAKTFNNNGAAYMDCGRFDEAADAFNTALKRAPHSVDIYHNLGALLIAQSRPDEAVDVFRAALAIEPSVEVRFNLALALLHTGDLANGWPEMEVRWQTKSFRRRQHNMPAPLWRGERFDGRTLLLHHEQGIGDTLQMIRYLPQVASRGGDVIVNCPRTLLPLLRNIPGRYQWVCAGDAIPKFDLQCPLMSLPLAMGTTLESIPRDVPYLYADDALIGAWRARLSHDAGLKIGLVWAGSPEHTNDRNRSLTLALLAPLASPGVTFYSLQKGPAASQLAQPPAGMTLVDCGPELHDFADTAALVANLDLVIGVDTSVVHLAGAMGRPVWTLLPFSSDWRWLVGREDSPWYPTMRLIRQSAHGDWRSAIDRAAGMLRAQLSSGGYHSLVVPGVTRVVRRGGSAG